MAPGAALVFAGAGVAALLAALGCGAMMLFAGKNSNQAKGNGKDPRQST